MVMNNSLLNIFISLLFLLSAGVVFGQPKDELQISHYTLKENLNQNDKLAILVVDSAEKPVEHINGTFQFTINGFNYPLSFHDGVAITPNKIESSTFVYLQHKNSSGNHAALFYVLKKDSGLQIYKIDWYILILIPIGLLFLVMLFKRFIWIAVILFGLYLYYNAQKGLQLGNFIEIILEGLKGLL